MLCASPLLLLLGLCAAAAAFQLPPEEAAPRRARFSANTPGEVTRCLNSAVAVGCGFFSCLENSTCDTDGMHEICELFLQSAASFNTEGKTFVKRSLQCISQGISNKVFQAIRRCNIFQRMIAEVQEECYTSLDICTVARTNPNAIVEVVQVPSHFPNRYYSTLLQTLQACDEQTVEAVRAGVIARVGPDMEEHAGVQHPAQLHRPGPHPPVRQEVRGGPGQAGGGPCRRLDVFISTLTPPTEENCRFKTTVS
uniref:Stanniocalcin n=1 Tax=Oryzias latipes TaxID=8090 RepID=A0A3B3HDX8_ORYLA